MTKTSIYLFSGEAIGVSSIPLPVTSRHMLGL